MAAEKVSRQRADLQGNLYAQPDVQRPVQQVCISALFLGAVYDIASAATHIPWLHIPWLLVGTDRTYLHVMNSSERYAHVRILGQCVWQHCTL